MQVLNIINKITMKTGKSIFAITVLALMLSSSAMAQSETKVLAVINKADWCSVCKANDERAMAVFMKNNKGGVIKFFTNDVTNDQTKMKSKEELKMVGMDKVIEKYQGTGLVSFFNSQTRAFISQISVSETDNKLTDAMTAAIDSLN